MKTHVIDGKTYVEVERKAKVGDMVVIVDDQIVEHKGLIGIVEIAYSDSYASVNVGNTVDYYPYVAHNEYRVLEPIETVDTTQASPQVIDMLANLARRVTSLEQQLRDTQGNVERQAEEIADVRHRGHNNLLDIREIYTWLGDADEKVERVLDDIVTLDERTQPQADSAFETITLPKWFIVMLTKLDGGAKR